MSLTNELEKLKQLHEEGAISDEEFAAGKARILADGGEAAPAIPFADEVDAARAEKETRQWALLLHISMLAGYAVPLAGLVAPIVIWQIKKNELPDIDLHGVNAVNWIISYVIYMVICIPLCFVLIGIPLLLALVAMGIAFPIIAAMKGNSGIIWRYPLSIRFLK